jgi:hypothetical protein
LNIDELGFNVTAGPFPAYQITGMAAVVCPESVPFD